MRRSAWLSLFFFAVVVGAAIVRLLPLLYGEVHGDEYWHLNIARQPNLAATLRLATFAHPPGIHIFQHALGPMTASVIAVRLWSFLFSLLAVWFGWKWLSLLGGRVVGLGGAFFLSFHPLLAGLGVELRTYSLLLAGAIAGLWGAEVHARRSSWVALGVAMIASAVAAMMHFSFALFLPLLHAYAGWRLWRRRAPRARYLSWALASLPGIALAAYFLVRLHLEAVPGFDANWRAGYLRPTFFQPGSESLFHYAWRSGLSFLSWPRQLVLTEILASTETPVGLLALFLCAWAWTARRLGRAGDRSMLMLLVLFPLAWGMTLGALAAYPFGLSRHTTYLFPFAAAAFGLAWGAVFRGKRALIGGASLAALASCLAVFSVLSFQPPHRTFETIDQRHERLGRAVLSVVAEGSAVYAAYGDSKLLEYLLSLSNGNACESIDLVETRLMSCRVAKRVLFIAHCWTFLQRPCGQQIDRFAISLKKRTPYDEFWLFSRNPRSAGRIISREVAGREADDFWSSPEVFLRHHRL